MSSNVANSVSFLRSSREFPEDPRNLVIEISKTYQEIATSVNSRVIGLFPTNRPAITGEEWFITSQKQQTLRQIYTFTSTAAIPHGINFTNIDRFTSCYGEFTDGTNWYGLISGSNVAIAGQISFYLDPTNINFLTGAGAPAITKGNIVLSWLSFT